MTTIILDRGDRLVTSKTIHDLPAGIVLASSSNTVVCASIDIYPLVTADFASYPAVNAAPAVLQCEC
jgi:hypothetical protein